MKTTLKKATGFIKNHKLLVINVAILSVLVSVPVYGHFANKSLARMQADAEAKLTKQLEDNKAKLTARMEAKKVADVAITKAAEEAAAKKAADDAAAKAAAESAAQAAKKQAKTKPAGTTAPTSGKYINISAGAVVQYDGKAKVPISWSSSFASEKGYKLVWSTSPAPVYPGSSYGYYSEPVTSGSGYVKGTPGSVVYVRVCEYLGGACGVYSNQLTIQL